MSLSRELPADVLSIIRDYSKPVFPWFKEVSSLSLSVHHMEKLKKKIGDPTIRAQLKICVDACDEHKQTYDTMVLNRTRLNEELESKADWRASESREKLCAMLCDHTYHGMNYAAWYFKDDMDDAWMDSDDDGWTDSDDDGWTEEDEVALAAQDAWMKEHYPRVDTVAS